MSPSADVGGRSLIKPSERVIADDIRYTQRIRMAATLPATGQITLSLFLSLIQHCSRQAILNIGNPIPIYVCHAVTRPTFSLYEDRAITQLRLTAPVLLPSIIRFVLVEANFISLCSQIH